MLAASSVVRGSRQGDSHGGVYLIDIARRRVEQRLDWNKTDIDWHGRGGDRGLRGMATHEDTLFIAASDELFACDPGFRLRGAWKNPYLKHCHEICVYRDQVFLCSTGFDSVLAFDIAASRFHWGLHVETDGFQFRARRFDPNGDDGPLMLNKLHLNSVLANDHGLYLAGLKSGGLLLFNGREIAMSATLPAGTHNARPWAEGVLFNDTRANRVRFAGRNPADDRAFDVPALPRAALTGTAMDTSGLARARFARGLCVVGDQLIAGGCSPSTVALYDFASGQIALTVTLSTDVRNAIHGLVVWPWT